jgi:hypothetical protein
LGLLIARYASADAATVHRATVDLRARQHVIVRPKGVAAPTRFGVPGWTDEQTQKWLDNACMYRKLKLGGNGDEVRRGWRVTPHRRCNAAAIAIAGFNRNDYRNLSVTRPQKSAKSSIKWRAIQNKIANPY